MSEARQCGTESPRYQWFSCKELSIAIDISGTLARNEMLAGTSHDAVVSDLFNAVILAEYELLLQCLADWMGVVHDWRPSEYRETDSGTAERKGVHEFVNMPEITVVLKCTGEPCNSLFVCIPKTEIRDMPALPVKWRTSVTLDVLVSSSRVAIYDQLLTPKDYRKLGPGAMLMIDESFSQHWMVCIADDAQLSTMESRFNNVLLDKDNALLRVMRNTGVEEMPSCEAHVDGKTIVYLHEPCVFNRMYAESIWQAGGAMVVELKQSLEGSAVKIYLQDGVEEPKPRVLAGVLVRVGSGFAVLCND